MLEALIAGQHDPAVLTELAQRRMRAKIPALTEALTGRFSDHHRFMARLFLDRIDAHNADIARLDTRIQEAMEPFQVARDLLVSRLFSRIVAEVFIAETGADMTVFPTAGHLASWAGLSPGSNESAGRTKSTKTRPGNRYLKGALAIAAWNLLVNGDFYRDPGPDYYTAHQPTKTRAHAIKQLEALGYKVTLAPLANSA